MATFQCDLVVIGSGPSGQKGAIAAAKLGKLEHETECVRSQFKRNQIRTVTGTARFADPHTVEVETEDGPTTIQARHTLIACGTRAAHSSDIPLDGRRIFDCDQLSKVDRIPRQLIVVGAGIVGLE